jgi:hypothetical protein
MRPRRLPNQTEEQWAQRRNKHNKRVLKAEKQRRKRAIGPNRPAVGTVESVSFEDLNRPVIERVPVNVGNLPLIDDQALVERKSNGGRKRRREATNLDEEGQPKFNEEDEKKYLDILKTKLYQAKVRENNKIRRINRNLPADKKWKELDFSRADDNYAHTFEGLQDKIIKQSQKYLRHGKFTKAEQKALATQALEVSKKVLLKRKTYKNPKGFKYVPNKELILNNAIESANPANFERIPHEKLLGRVPNLDKNGVERSIPKWVMVPPGTEDLSKYLEIFPTGETIYELTDAQVRSDNRVNSRNLKVQYASVCKQLEKLGVNKRTTCVYENKLAKDHDAIPFVMAKRNKTKKHPNGGERKKFTSSVKTANLDCKVIPVMTKKGKLRFRMASVCPNCFHRKSTYLKDDISGGKLIKGGKVDFMKPNGEFNGFSGGNINQDILAITR